MKKTFAFITVAALVLVIAASLVVSAAPPQTPAGPQQGKAVTLTEAQKQELAPLYDKMAETRKQIMQKYVDFGYMTQEQADQRAAWMKERMNNHLEKGFGPGMMGRGHGMMGRGPGGGPGSCQQQQPATNK